jgi:hypothetical protein
MQHRTSTPFSDPSHFVPQPADFPINESSDTHEVQSTRYEAESVAGKASLLSTLFVHLFGYRDKYFNHALWLQTLEIFSKNPPAKFTNWYNRVAQPIIEEQAIDLTAFVTELSLRLVRNFNTIDEDALEKLQDLVEDSYQMIFWAACGRFKASPSEWYTGPANVPLIYFIEVVNTQPFYDFGDLIRCDVEVEPNFDDDYAVYHHRNSNRKVRCVSFLPELLDHRPSLDQFPLKFKQCPVEHLTAMYAFASRSGRANMLASLYVALTGFEDKTMCFALWNAAYDQFQEWQTPTFTHWYEREDLSSSEGDFLAELSSITVERFYDCFGENDSAWSNFFIATWQYYEMVFGAAYSQFEFSKISPETCFRKITNELSFFDLADLTNYPHRSRSSRRSKEKLPADNTGRDASPVRNSK